MAGKENHWNKGIKQYLLKPAEEAPSINSSMPVQPSLFHVKAILRNLHGGNHWHFIPSRPKVRSAYEPKWPIRPELISVSVALSD